MIVLVAASVSLAVGLLTTVAMFREGGRDAALQSQRLVAIADVVASAAARSTAAGDSTGAFEALRAAGRAQGVVYGRIENIRGGALAENGAGARLASDVVIDAGPGARPRLADLLQTRTVKIQTPIVRNRQTVGRVVLLARSEGVGRRLAWSLAGSLLAGLGAAAVGMLLAWRMQRGITAPIIDLTRLMDEVERTHDYQRTVPAGANDEVGDLVRGFDRMLTEIRGRDRQLAEHLDGLERTVAERTADLATAKDAAESANRAKSDFLATMSHEIRTPMNGIMVMAEMLAAGDLPARQKRFADVIAKSGASLIAIINDILDVSKIEAGKLELEQAEVDPAAAVEDVCSLFRERARSKGLDLAAYIDPAVPALVLGDEVRLRQVIGNLVNNAIKFTEHGGVLVELTLAEDGVLNFAIRDTGIGIPQDRIGALFEAFTQADQSTTRRFGGTGLGLTISKRLVDAMGGRFDVTSVLGEGSTFAFTAPAPMAAPAPPWPRLGGAVAVDLAPGVTGQAISRYLREAGLEPGGEGTVTARVGGPASFDGGKDAPAICLADYDDPRAAALQQQGTVDAVLVLPVRRREIAALLAQLAAGERLTGEAVDAVQAQALERFDGYRVLVADDSDVNREVATEALARLGVKDVVTAADGREALELVKSQAFDLVLMDGSMPEMDGYDSARAIRALETEQDRPRLPVVALTAHVVGPAAQAWREAGMDAVLHKPFTVALLARTLGQFLEPRAAGDLEPEVASPATEPVDRPVSSELIDAGVAADLAAMAAAGRGDFVQRIHRLYREKAPQAAATLAQAVADADADAAIRAAHALKSMSLNVGAKGVSQLTGRLETQGREGTAITAADAAEVAAVVQATLAVLGRDDEAAVAPPATPSVSPAASPDDDLRAALRRALKQGEFSIAYQPQMNRDGKVIVGAEALLRWTRPNGQQVGPQLFIPAAERLGMIAEVTDWVIERTLDEARYLDLPVAVNASALEFGLPDFPDRIAKALRRHGYPARNLEIEITETAVMNDEAGVQRSLETLKAMGVPVALDDFGSGYSSLQRLRRFGCAKLKVDREFVTGCATDMQSAAILHAIIALGRALGMKVLAEGVETPEQHQFLRIAGVHALQGYLFHKPLRIGDFPTSRPEALSA